MLFSVEVWNNGEFLFSGLSSDMGDLKEHVSRRTKFFQILKVATSGLRYIIKSGKPPGVTSFGNYNNQVYFFQNVLSTGDICPIRYKEY